MSVRRMYVWVMSFWSLFVISLLPYSADAGVLHSVKHFSNFLFTDGLTILFLLLTMLIVYACFIIGMPVNKSHRTFMAMIFALGFLLIVTFSTTNLLWFYVAFEVILLPTYMLIGRWGSQSERVYAAFIFFLYTLVGSVFFLVALALIHKNVGSFSYRAVVGGLEVAPEGLKRVI